MSKNRDIKIGLVGELTEKTKRAKIMVFTDYRGLKHVQLETFRKALKAVNAQYLVAKNTLLKISLSEDIKLTDEEKKHFEQPTGTLFGYEDVIAPLKELAKLIKELKMPVIKFGILDGKAITASQVTKLATLPSREVLLAQVVGGMKSPIFGLHRALNWNMQKLVLTLKAIESKKS